MSAEIEHAVRSPQTPFGAPVIFFFFIFLPLSNRWKMLLRLFCAVHYTQTGDAEALGLHTQSSDSHSQDPAGPQMLVPGSFWGFTKLS